MTQAGLPELLAKIEQASADAREVIRAAHEATRDLKVAMDEARKVTKRMAGEVELEYTRCVRDELGALFDGLNDRLKAHVDVKVEQIDREFEQLRLTYLRVLADAGDLHDGYRLAQPSA